MPPVDWESTAQEAGKKLRRAAEVIRMAYRKHAMGDDSVGSEELSDALMNYLCDEMGDRGFQEWLRQAGRDAY